jgi:hypothetical protein
MICRVQHGGQQPVPGLFGVGPPGVGDGVLHHPHAPHVRFGARLWGGGHDLGGEGSVGGADGLGVDSRLVGSFRAHGLLVPVWDLPVGTAAEALETPAADFAQRLASALDDTSPLSMGQRAARAGLANRQVTIR